MGSHGNCVLGRAASSDHFQSDATLLEDSTERTADVEGGKSSLASAHTPSPLLPFPSPLLLSLSPSLLFVLGTYQPERVKRRREGGGVIQHVRQGRGGKKRIACGAGHGEQTVRLPEQD